MNNNGYDIAHETPKDAEMFGFCDEPDCDGEVFWYEACENWHKDLEGRSDV